MASQILVALCVLLLNMLVNVQGYNFTVGPSADDPITKFEATLTVPPFSNAPNDNKAGTWAVAMRNSNYGAYATDDKIFPGDKIYSIFEYNRETLVTTNNVTIIPGAASIKAGLKQRNYNRYDNIQTNTPAAGLLNVARLRFLLGGNASWDFGPIIWENVTITFATTDPSWCSHGWKASDDLNVTGRVTLYWGEGDQTHCEYKYMSWEPAKTN
ncbi:hypothetical protein DSL72_008502 [Monilinia vaccinii-corymbosi]|uniref:Ubiquitin 3 binding protein But2 C-terminal domain-containing protein n=1 Tax=Monilinia vaccinii-corymbosi TaxID=61207 RepID=A0A8A3PJV8_9HELO|nr:hypothetical protein DSL72_008502 [Monilinia vaccinii-corymbosi]